MCYDNTMSKEQLTTIAATIIALVTILAFLWDISNRISEMEKRLGAFEARAAQAMLSDKTAETQ